MRSRDDGLERLPHAVTFAQESDAPQVAALARQLGYAPSEDGVRECLRERGDDFEVLVARAGGRVVGWASIRLGRSLTQPRSARLEGLIVDAAFRRAGIGAELLARVERWARERGHTELQLNSNVLRSDAHRFYAREGYTIRKSQHIFTKSL